jgi:hypothetical protein
MLKTAVPLVALIVVDEEPRQGLASNLHFRQWKLPKFGE